MVGAQGAGASAAALLATWAGADVDGCDPGGPSPYTPALDAAGVTVAGSHDPAHVRAPGTRPPERLAVTKALTAIDPDNSELAAARAAGVPLEPWQQVVADAAFGRQLMAVAGTHGKSTTSGWLVHVLTVGGADPGAFVGALLPADETGIGLPATARRGSGRPFVVEADEYAGNFDPYRPDVIVLTSAEWDHPDVFADGEAVIAAFEAWIRRAGEGRVHGDGLTLVANVADAGVEALVLRLGGWPGRILGTAVLPAGGAGTSGADSGATAAAIEARFASAAGPATALVGRITGAERDATVVEVVGLDAGAPREPWVVRLSTAGRHNAANALGVAGAALAAGLTPDAIVAGLASFGGVGRRLERKGEARGVVVYDDYGHHPTAIRETLAAVRQREPARRVWAVYEPLTYHRTAALLEAFAQALAAADGVAIAQIWAGRDPDTTVASATALAEAVARRNPAIAAAAPGTVEETAAWLATQVHDGDVVLVMGGGRSYRIGELLLEHLEAT
ncbi:MAG TPA: cyanophycin synthetase [Candidatus Limnocylindrales bacterium]|nr:cyanophycin synthetase [Candidatus Limnocylindrales bacterium]